MNRDEYQLEEVSGAVGLGLLAGDVVIAASRLLRGADLSKAETDALKGGHALLVALSAPLDEVHPAYGPGHLASKRSAIDALHAVQNYAPAKDVQDFARPLAESVESVLKTGLVAGHEGAITSVRDLFTSLSDLEVARVTNLSRPRPEEPRWATSLASSAS